MGASVPDATADIVDAHVAICAQRAGQAVVTSDADGVRRIAPEPAAPRQTRLRASPTFSCSLLCKV